MGMNSKRTCKAITRSAGKVLPKTPEEVCAQYNTDCCCPSLDDGVGVALNTLRRRPLHGMRQKPEEGISGWYIWAGKEYGSDPNVYQPMTVAELLKKCPGVAPYLGLPPGYRFSISSRLEDVWYDDALLH
jgi:hypothetical protein